MLEIQCLEGATITVLILLWPLDNQMSVSLQGPIKVTVQELDGSFNHTLQIEENSLKHDIPCHSKSRRYVL